MWPIKIDYSNQSLLEEFSNIRRLIKNRAKLDAGTSFWHTDNPSILVWSLTFII